jgi:hypothetical protein
MVSAFTKPITVFTTTLNKGRELPEHAEPSVVIEGTEPRRSSPPLQAQPLREDLKETRREARRALPVGLEEASVILRASIHEESALSQALVRDRSTRPPARAGADSSVAERGVAELLARQRRNHRLILAAATLGLLGVVAVLILSEHDSGRSGAAASDPSTVRAPQASAASPPSSETAGPEAPDTEVISVSDLASAAPEPSHPSTAPGRRSGSQRLHPPRGLR